MTKKFEPELGQAFFGQSAKEFDAPLLLIAALHEIERVLNLFKLNEEGESYDSPFDNTGNSFKCDEFEVHAYSWDDEVEQKFNFKWKEIEVSWYKHLGRGTSVNMEVQPDKIQELLEACVGAIDILNIKHLKARGVI